MATDGSSPATAAVNWAAREAISRQETLLIVTASPPSQVPPSALKGAAAETMAAPLLDKARLQEKEARELVLAAADGVRRSHPDLVVTTEVFQGDPRDALELYQAIASVLVMGSRGLGSVRSVLLGSLSLWATRHLSRPFVVVRPPDTERVSKPHGVAVGIRDRDDSEGVLRAAFTLASRRSCKLTVANAAWDSEMPGNTWRTLNADDVDPRRRGTVTGLVSPVAADFPGVDYSVLFARGRVDAFLASLGRSHEAVVLGRGRPTLLDFIGLGTLASFVIEHGLGATVIIPTEGEQA